MNAGSVEHLVRMANQIALNFGERREPGAAARKTAEHIGKFWTPAMRARLADHAAEGGEGMTPAARQAFNPDTRS